MMKILSPEQIMSFKIGVQLYTVREFTKTPDGIARSLEKVAAIGYPAVQISGFGPADPEQVNRWAKDNGLIIASTHIGWNDLLNDLETVIGIHRLWNCKHPAIGGLPGEYFSLDGLQRFLDEVLPIAARLAEYGMDFSYHNHNHELKRYGSQTWLAQLYDRASHDVLKAEIDTYWIQAGGGDPAWWVQHCAGREPLLHLKDMAVGPEREQRMAEIGEGNLNWPAILAAAQAGGVEWLLVEQDTCYERDPFESLAISYKNLTQLIDHSS
jgi:sugar phosphate isomerase/epimerase